MGSQVTPECPNCSSHLLAVERRPDGDAKCTVCDWSGPYKSCFAAAANRPTTSGISVKKGAVPPKRKYRFKVFYFNAETREVEVIATMTTKPIPDAELDGIILAEMAKAKTACCYQILTQRPLK